MELQGVVSIPLFLSALVCLSFHQSLSATTKQVTLRSSSDCDNPKSVHMIGKDYNEYRVVMQWKPYKCLEHERGFSCSQTFIQENNFSNLGMQLCIDIQGVQFDISGMNQLLLTVSDREGDLKKVFTITRLRPEGSPYYVCTKPNLNYLSVSLSVRPSVKICPEVLDYLFTNTIRLGTVKSVPQSPIIDVNLDWCTIDEIPKNNSYLIKVITEGSKHKCNLGKMVPTPYSYMRACLKVVYFSNDFDCDVNVRLSSGSSGIEMPLDRSPGGDMQRCDTYSRRNGSPRLYFEVFPYSYRVCRGNFALSLDIRQTPPPDRDDDDTDKRSPNLYMAVFITLIAICLVCLGLTCLCCIRFRAKRLRRLQRRGHHRQVSVPNQGFQYDIANAPPYENNVSWSPTQPGMLYGLPSYDDVVAESSGGINPSDDSYKNDLPPAYDSVCSTSET